MGGGMAWFTCVCTHMGFDCVWHEAHVHCYAACMHGGVHLVSLQSASLTGADVQSWTAVMQLMVQILNVAQRMHVYCVRYIPLQG